MQQDKFAWPLLPWNPLNRFSSCTSAKSAAINCFLGRLQLWRDLRELSIAGRRWLFNDAWWVLGSKDASPNLFIWLVKTTIPWSHDHERHHSWCLDVFGRVWYFWWVIIILLSIMLFLYTYLMLFYVIWCYLWGVSFLGSRCQRIPCELRWQVTQCVS